MDRQATSRRDTRNSGFTLIELALSLGILTLLLGAIASMMSLAARAIPKETDSDQQVSTLRLRLADFCTDLSLAKSITSASPTDITFVVPDRDNDGTDETIRYAWSGISGDPFARTAGGVSNASMIAGVQSLSITLISGSRERSVVTGTVDSAEQLLSSYTGATTGSTTVDSTSRTGLCIVPNLASNVTAWQLTRLRYRITSSAGSSYAHTLKIYNPNGQGWVDESSLLASYDVAGAVAASSTNIANNVATTGLPWKTRQDSLWAILGQPTSGTAKYTVPFASVGHMCYTDTRSRVLVLDIWAMGGKDNVLFFEAYGKTRTTATEIQSYKAVERVQVAIRLATGEQATISTRLWNMPEPP